jgi:hypothetical protein
MVVVQRARRLGAAATCHWCAAQRSLRAPAARPARSQAAPGPRLAGRPPPRTAARGPPAPCRRRSTAPPAADSAHDRSMHYPARSLPSTQSLVKATESTTAVQLSGTGTALKHLCTAAVQARACGLRSSELPGAGRCCGLTVSLCRRCSRRRRRCALLRLSHAVCGERALHVQRFVRRRTPHAGQPRANIQDHRGTGTHATDAACCSCQALFGSSNAATLNPAGLQLPCLYLVA